MRLINIENMTAMSYNCFIIPANRIYVGEKTLDLTDYGILSVSSNIKHLQTSNVSQHFIMHHHHAKSLL